jgi:hypothetical protein
MGGVEIDIRPKLFGPFFQKAAAAVTRPEVARRRVVAWQLPSFCRPETAR